MAINDCGRSVGRLASLGCVFSSLLASSICVAQPGIRANLAASSEPPAHVARAPSKIGETFADQRPLSGTNETAAISSGVCLAAGRDEYLDIIRSHARRNALPVNIADAVAYIESRYRSEKIGKAGEIGLMQIRPATAAMLGFRGSDIELAEPATNIRYGVSYLAKAWRLASGNICMALAKYRAGHREKRMSLLSVRYCRLAKTYLRNLHASRAINVSAADPSASVSPIGSQ